MFRVRLRLLPAIATLVVVALPSSLLGQACLGQPSFALNHLQMTAGANFDKTSTSFGANFISGSESVFGGIGIGGATFDGFEGSSLLAGATAGFQVPLTDGGAQICPIVSAQFGFGPNDFDGLGTDFTSRGVNFGIAAGGEMFKSERIAVLPSASIAFAYAEGRFDGVGGSVTTSDTYALAGLALGFLISDKLAVRPSVSFPIGLEDADPVFGIGFALNYGGRR